MAKVWRVFGDQQARTDYERAQACFDEGRVASDVRAVQILAALDAGAGAADIARWCADLVAQRDGDVLLDSHDATEPHLWGHIQEGVLAVADPWSAAPNCSRSPGGALTRTWSR